MCGIAGIVGGAWSEPEIVVGRMLDALRHRGPDDVGTQRSGIAVLGARRLSIIDVAGGHQPMSGETGRVVAVQNGEIYNFREIRSELVRRGHRFRTDNDTEVIPHAYEEYGDGFVDHLRGMFALALWDADAGRLLLARDRIGKKPLFYARAGSGLLFASEIQGLLSTPLDLDVDDEAVLEYLRLGYVLAPRSGFRQIRKVRPGDLLTFEEGQVSERSYWRLATRPKLEIDVEEAAERLRNEIDDAVRARLVSDVPLGAFLSGGMDSSTVVEAMARLSPGRVRTFSIGFPEGDHSELRYARLVAERFGTDHHEFIVEPSAADVLPMLVRHLGEPFADSSIIPTYYVAKTARAHVTVALNGDGGDELFAGYERYQAAWLASRLELVPPFVRAALGDVAARLPDGPAMPLRLRRLRRFVTALANGAEDRYFRWHGYFGSSDIYGERLRPLAASARWPVASSDGDRDDVVGRLLVLDLETYLPGDLLVKMDIATMAGSLEARSPFLDHRLVEFVSRLPTDMKLRAGRSKFLLRKLMTGVLPDEVLDRPKMGLVVPVGEWLRGPLRPLVDEVLLSGPDRGYVDRDACARLVRAHLGRRVEATKLVWALLMLDLWFRYVVEAARPRTAQVVA